MEKIKGFLFAVRHREILIDRFGINDYQRSRVTGGMTLSIDKPFVSDIRLNYEQYFYRDGAIPKPSENNKIVLEVMTRF